MVVAVAAGIVWIAVTPRIGRQPKVALLTIALCGAAFGIVGRLAPGNILGVEESLVTLSVGRPALLVIALTPPGTARPFFRRSFAATGAYFGTAFVAHASGFLDSFILEGMLGAGAAAAVLTVAWQQKAIAPPDGKGPIEPDRASVPRAAQVEDWERLLAILSTADRGLSRRELADALGILPRNVQRVVDAANRSPRALPGVDLVHARFERGKRNQLEYRYELTTVGRSAAPAGAPGSLPIKAGAK